MPTARHFVSTINVYPFQSTQNMMPPIEKHILSFYGFIFCRFFIRKDDVDEIKDCSAKDVCLTTGCAIPLPLAIAFTLHLSGQIQDPTTKGFFIAGAVGGYLLFLISVVLCFKSCKEEDNNERQRLSPKA